MKEPSFSLLVPTHLRVNLLTFAYNVDDSPSFSWWDHSTTCGSKQVAYEIVIASRLHLLASKEYIYDSSWISSSNNTYVKLPKVDDILHSSELYYWQVRVKDNYGIISDYSEPSKFMCKFLESYFQVNGIWSSKEATSTGMLPNLGNVVFLRSPEFEINKDDYDSAILTAFSRGSEPQFIQGFDLLVNNKTIGVGSARPQPNYYGRTNLTGVYYNSFDVTEELRDGKNIISAIAGGTSVRRAFWATLVLFMVDGSKKVVITSGKDWKAKDGTTAFGDYGSKIRSIYFEMIPENISMKAFPVDWGEVNFDDRGWPNAVINSRIMIDETEIAIPYRSQKTLRIETKEPLKKIIIINKFDKIVDLGKEIIGSLKVSLASDIEQQIDVQFGEQLTSCGNVRHHLAAGPDYVETWHLKKGQNNFSTFQIKNFRYIEIIGFHGELNVDSLCGWAVEQPFDSSEGLFQCENDLLNREYELSKYTIKATNQDIFVDSQARERRPYEGDLLVNGLSSYAVSSDYSLTRHTVDYLIDNPTWPEDYKLFNVEMAWVDYMYSGNKDLLETRYKDLQYKLNRGKNDESFDGASEDFKGSLRNVKGIDNFDSKVGLVTNDGLVDWPINERDGFIEGTYNTPFNAVFYGVYMIMSKIAKVTNHLVDEKFYSKRAERIKLALVTRLYDKKNGRFFDSLNQDLSINRHSSHHSSAYALCYGIYDGKDMSEKLSNFVFNNGEFVGSVYFIYFMLKGLIESDHVDKAITLLANPDNEKNHKTFAAVLDRLSATIAPEAWSNEYKSNLTLSHPWGATPGLIIVQGVLGIVPLQAGYDLFSIKIRPGEMKYLTATVPSVKGLIRVKFVKEASSSIITAVIPMNSAAIVELPENSTNVVLKSDKESKIIQSTNGIKIPSGKYTITYKF